MQLYQNYDRAFLLEEKKLNSLLEKIHELLGDHGVKKKSDEFELFVAGNRVDEKNNLEDVLKHHNTANSKIKRLLIRCGVTSDATGIRPEREIQLDMDGRKLGSPKIILSVRSDDAAWNADAITKVGEEIDRIYIDDGPYRFILIMTAVLSFVVILWLLASAFGTANNAYGYADVMWLQRTNMPRIDEILKQGSVITDEQLREITTMQLQNISDVRRENLPTGWDRQKTYIAVPLSAELVLALYLISRCYPRAVFHWGDEVDHYKHIVLTRRVVWTFILGIGGTVTKLLYS
jgi:hypothetical protein